VSVNLFWDLMSALGPKPPRLMLHAELSRLIREGEYAEAYVLALLAERVPEPVEVVSMSPTLRAIRQKMGLPVPLSPTQIVAQHDAWSLAIERALGWKGSCYQGSEEADAKAEETPTPPTAIASAQLPSAPHAPPVQQWRDE